MTKLTEKMDRIATVVEMIELDHRQVIEKIEVNYTSAKIKVPNSTFEYLLRNNLLIKAQVVLDRNDNLINKAIMDNIEVYTVIKK